MTDEGRRDDLPLQCCDAEIGERRDDCVTEREKHYEVQTWRLTMETDRPPLPPFTTVEAAVQKVRLAEDAWNTRDPPRVALAYTIDSRWRNRHE